MSFQVAMQYTKKYGADKVRVLTLVKNRGKGGAVRMVSLSCGAEIYHFIAESM